MKARFRVIITEGKKVEKKVILKDMEKKEGEESGR